MRFSLLASVFFAAACSATGSLQEEMDWPVQAHYRALAERQHFESWKLERTDSDYAKRFQAQSQEPTELREYVFHGVYRAGDPAAKGAQGFDETILAKKFEATPFPEWNVEKMVLLASGQRLQLKGLDDVRWFLHGENDALVEVEATADPARYRFRRNYSGPPDIPPWRTLVLDASGVPQRIE
jgi:hypothetical protein